MEKAKKTMEITTELGDALNQSKDKLVSDFKSLISGAEELLKTTANYSGEGFAAARAKFEEKLENARSILSDVQETALDQYKQAAAATDGYVRENPWKAVGIAAAAGVLVGLLTMKR